MLQSLGCFWGLVAVAAVWLSCLQTPLCSCSVCYCYWYFLLLGKEGIWDLQNRRSGLSLRQQAELYNRKVVRRLWHWSFRHSNMGRHWLCFRLVHCHMDLQESLYSAEGKYSWLGMQLLSKVQICGYPGGFLGFLRQQSRGNVTLRLRALFFLQVFMIWAFSPSVWQLKQWDLYGHFSSWE